MSKSTNKTTTIIATSDLHGLLDGVEDCVRKAKADILVIAGDIHPARIDVNADQWFKSEFFPLVGRLPCEVVAVPGNHDFWLASHLGTYQLPYVPKNFHLLFDEEIEICGIRFYGTPWVPTINGRWCFEADEEDLATHFSKIPRNVDILISHSPPKGDSELFDVSMQHDSRYWRHFGSSALRDAIGKKTPKLLLCGHIHSGDHQPINIVSRGEKLINGITTVCNVSRVNERYQIAYEPLVMEYQKGSGLFLIKQ